MSIGTGGPRGRNPAVRLLPVLLGLLAVGVMAITNCREGPFGRRQLVALDPQQEEELGLQAFQEVLAQERTVRRGPVVEAVRAVAERLTAATSNAEFLAKTKLPEQPMKWLVEVVESNQQNAFCLPGGKIVVYTGILPAAETDAGLATVMGHEIAHALAHHGAERMAHAQMAQVGIAAAGGALGDMDPQQRMRLMQLMNAGAKFGILAYGRDHESEADHMGLLLMAAAGYDPRESVRFWERMQQLSKGAQPPQFLSTHPNHETRMRDLTTWMPEALPLYEAAPSKRKPQALPVESLLVP